MRQNGEEAYLLECPRSGFGTFAGTSFSGSDRQLFNLKGRSGMVRRPRNKTVGHGIGCRLNRLGVFNGVDLFCHKESSLLKSEILVVRRHEMK